MPSSWSTYSTLKPRTRRRPFKGVSLSQVTEALAAQLAPARYLAHTVLVLILVVLAQNVLPRSLPTLKPLALETVATVATEPAAQPVASYASEGAAQYQARYLARSAVPFTVRSYNSVLPMAEPRQREVRTGVFTYRVEPGDSVLGIALKFGLQGNSLLWANEELDLNPDFLQVGQSLYILPVDGAYHTVVRGETLQGIADKYKVSSEAIISFAENKLTASATLAAGQRLVIPGGVKPRVARQVFSYKTSAPPKDAAAGSGTLSWAMTGSISQGFWEGHQAIDISNRGRPPVAAADAGFVSYVQSSNTGYGRMVIIDHGNGYETLYAHLDAIYVKVGQSVAKGEVIGKCGSTGNSTGPHLHFEVIKNGVRRNPMAYLP